MLLHIFHVIFIYHIYNIFIKTCESVAPRHHGCFRDMLVNERRPMKLSWKVDRIIEREVHFVGIAVRIAC